MQHVVKWTRCIYIFRVETGQFNCHCPDFGVTVHWLTDFGVTEPVDSDAKIWTVTSDAKICQLGGMRSQPH